MNFVLSFIETWSNIFGSGSFLLLVKMCSIILKGSALIFLLIRVKNAQGYKKLFQLFIVLILLGSIIENTSWIIKLIRMLYYPILTLHLENNLINFAWIFTILHYQMLAFFIVNLNNKKFSLSKWHLGCLLTGAVLATYYFIQFIIGLYSDQHYILDLFYLYRNPIRTASILYILMIMAQSVASAIFKRIYQKKDSPVILQRQLKVFINYIIIPYVAIDTMPVLINIFNAWGYKLGTENTIYSLQTFSEILLLSALYFSIRKVIRLRFLNIQEHVQAPKRISFIDNFKDVLEQLSHITNTNELNHIVQHFYKDIFNISLNRTQLYIRNLSYNNESEPAQTDSWSATESLVENFITSLEQNSELYHLLKKTKILITDELDFSNFYDQKSCIAQLLHFLENIHADVFIPIYNHESICGYIIIERNARPKELFTDVERDEMLLFSTYVGNIIHLFHNRNLPAMIAQRKDLKEELYAKHQEINQYKESMRSFLRNSNTRKIGILFYKNRQFMYGNQTAHELISININTQEGHPLSKAIKTVARDVQKFHSPQSTLCKNAEGENIIIFGLLNLEKNNVIVLVYYPEISDILRKQIDLLKDPSNWDYLLYLETTKPGNLINQLIPSNSETLLNFKIELLKITLNKKAILLEIPEEDLESTVDIIHHISLRETLHTLNLQGPVTNSDICIQLFGMNPIFETERTTALLEKLNDNGTLFIKNIHYLDLESQNSLAEFIRYGHYHRYKSDHTASSNTRIITSSNQDLASLVQAGKFSQALYNELNKTTLTMPSLMTFSHQELIQLIEDYSKQSIESDSFSNLLEFTQREKEKLMTSGIVSLNEFRTRIQKLLQQKSKTKNIHQDVQFDTASHITDPDLHEAARLGKHALRDPKLMAKLWNKFGSQNKIALFLGVNRSSVNRRCKEYNLIGQ